MKDLKFTNIDTTIESGSGEAFYFTCDRGEYYIECWATENSGGEDIYHADDNTPVGWHELFDDEADELAFEQALDQLKANFYGAWARLAQPAIDQAVVEALFASGYPITMAASG